jgi:AcrR family transcriptional regulator
VRDAERSISAILDAASRVLGERPDASVEDIAKAAGISRQTVY